MFTNQTKSPSQNDDNRVKKAAHFATNFPHLTEMIQGGAPLFSAALACKYRRGPKKVCF